MNYKMCQRLGNGAVISGQVHFHVTLVLYSKLDLEPFKSLTVQILHSGHGRMELIFDNWNCHAATWLIYSLLVCRNIYAAETVFLSNQLSYCVKIKLFYQIVQQHELLNPANVLNSIIFQVAHKICNL